MDSCAGKHMAFRKDYFCKYGEINDGSAVTIGNKIKHWKQKVKDKLGYRNSYVKNGKMLH